MNVRDMTLTALHYEVVVCGAIAVVGAVAAAGLAANWWMLRRRGLPTERATVLATRSFKVAVVCIVAAGMAALVPWLDLAGGDGAWTVVPAPAGSQFR